MMELTKGEAIIVGLEQIRFELSKPFETPSKSTETAKPRGAGS